MEGQYVVMHNIPSMKSAVTLIWNIYLKISLSVLNTGFWKRKQLK